jgi:hypothetical protein
VVRADRVQELDPNARLQWRRSLLDQAQAQVHVAEQFALVGRPEYGPTRQLDRTAHVVEQRGSKQEIGPKARMELRNLAADRRDADGVLEKASRVTVVAVESRRQCAQEPAQLVVAARRRP